MYHACYPILTSCGLNGTIAGVTQYKRTGKWEAHVWIKGNGARRGECSLHTLLH